MKRSRIVFVVTIPVLFIVYAGFIQFFTGFHALQHGDSLLASIMSYTKPTLFYWGQNEFLSSLPLLFSFLRDPVQNLFWISSTQLLIIFFYPLLAAIVFFPGKKYGIWAISLVLMASLNRYFWFESCYQPYALSLLAALLGVWVFSRSMKSKRLVARQLLLVASAAIDVLAIKTAQPSIVIIVFWNIYIAARNMTVSLGSSEVKLSSATLRHDTGQAIVWFAWFALCFALFALLERLPFSDVVGKRMILLDLDPRTSFDTLIAMVRNFRAYDQYRLFALASIGISIAGYTILIVRRRLREVAISLLLFVVPGIIIALTMSSLEWVRANLNFPRYLLFCAYLLVLNNALIVYESAKTFRIPSALKVFGPILAIVASLTAVFVSFSPSPFVNVKDRIVAHYNYQEYLVFPHGNDGAIGNYWKVWPLVWAKNASGSKDFIGISTRSENISEQILAKLGKQGSLALIGFRDDSDLDPMISKWFPSLDHSIRVFDNKFVITVYESVGNKIQVSDLPRSGGTIARNGSVILKPNEYIYGPYSSYMKGKYRVQFRISGQPGSRALVRVTSDSGKRVFSEALTEAPVSLSFELSESASGVEFPVFNRGDTDITVESIRIEKLQ